ncbi:PAB-dependent poly(A)-specific ribonuclease subunit PAN2 [Ditylenchus destructor]|uniref:PAB-dependent poly(A)-specific ribonuclease subunit PAN2 n=1 Tax=Ditylenchus destructor TaxID=166010 RepID=A0AAD4NDB4_9BILA|nr:PAB-dependent poly(A)-specific ribonuclease subunit PAN2 [Ditylenchus destructor]
MDYTADYSTMMPGTSTMDEEFDDQTSDYRFAFLGNTMMQCTIQEITALKFDVYQELLWCGNSTGKVGSFFGLGLNEYTAFTAVNDTIQDIVALEEAVVVVSKNTIFGYKRQGLPLFEYRSVNFDDLTCICSHPVAPNSLILGGRQSKIVQMDAVTQKEQRTKQEKYLQLTMRSLNTIDSVSSTCAHTGGIADFDVCGNQVITCGFTNRSGGIYSDPFLKIYDVRMSLKCLAPHSVLFPPTMCRFANPFSDGQLIYGSKFGHVMMTNLDNSCNELLYQYCTGVQMPCSMDVSSSRQCLAIGDTTGSICLFGDRQADSTFNQESWMTIFPTIDEPLPPTSINDKNSSIAVVPSPLPPTNGYCSDFWPENALLRQCRKSKPIPDEIIRVTKSAHSVLYAKNPRANTPLAGMNVCPYDLETTESQ